MQTGEVRNVLSFSVCSAMGVAHEVFFVERKMSPTPRLSPAVRDGGGKGGGTVCGRKRYKCSDDGGILNAAMDFKVQQREMKKSWGMEEGVGRFLPSPRSQVRCVADGENA